MWWKREFEGKLIEQVMVFKFMGIIITSINDSTLEVKRSGTERDIDISIYLQGLIRKHKY